MDPAQTNSITIRDPDGKVVSQSIPLSTTAYATVERWAMLPRQIPVSTDAEREQARDLARTLIKLHEAAREKDPLACSGNDLNNFWVLFESAPEWARISESPRSRWQLESGKGFSEKFLDEPLSAVAANIREAYRVHGIAPEKLRDSIQAATSAMDYTSPVWKELRTIYIHMRGLGYFDRELTQ